ncbi:MAG TPA: hypothetical protein PK360_19335, partial [bacterium]|nr:hypothetical protein [bacterium]
MTRPAPGNKTQFSTPATRNRDGAQVLAINQQQQEGESRHASRHDGSPAEWLESKMPAAAQS